MIRVEWNEEDSKPYSTNRTGYAMYTKCTKKQLAEMLCAANEHIDSIKPTYVTARIINANEPVKYDTYSPPELITYTN